MTVFTLLDREWQHLGTSRPARQQLRLWSITSPCLAQYADPAALVSDANRRGDPIRSDRILAALTPHATAADDLAGRTLLQALLPGLKALTRRYHPIGAAHGHDTASLVVAYAWQHICTYPHDRRPIRVAANIVSDTHQRLHRLVNRPAVRLVPLELLDHEPAAEPGGDDLHDWLEHAVDHGVLSVDDARLIAATRLGHCTIAELAPRFDCEPATLRRRRNRAETRLATVTR